MKLPRVKTGAAGAACGLAAIIAIVISSGEVRTNKTGLELIGNAEGCRREPYTCPAGVLTDGVGNTTNVKANTRKTDQQIASDWSKNILVAESCVNRYFRGGSMSDNQFSAMTSLAFNVGCAGIRTYYSKPNKKRVETSIHKYAQAGNWPMMCSHITEFDNSSAGKLPGLTARRIKEQALCMTKADDK